LPCNGWIVRSISIQTCGRDDFIDITDKVREFVVSQGVKDGVITVFVPHTTAGVTINENADPDVTSDIKMALDKIVPWRAGYSHGEGNSAAHVKASMMGSSVTVIVVSGRLQLGTWQAIYLCEFDGPRTRNVWVQ